MDKAIQLILAFVGISLTGVLGWSEYLQSRAQVINQAAENRISLMALYSEQVSSFTESCNRASVDIAKDAAVQLEALDRTTGIRYLDNLVNVANASSRCDDEIKKSLESRGLDAPAVPASVELASRLAITSDGPAVSDVPSGRTWYVVLSSMPVSTPRQEVGDRFAFFRQVAVANSVPGDIGLYRTTDSNYFAVVLTQPDMRAESARAAVDQFRTAGWSIDAYALNDRNWTRCDVSRNGDVLAGCSVQGLPQGPSFDCTKASARVDVMICANPTLSELDRRMSRAYDLRHRGLDSGGRQELLDAQRAWWRMRQDCRDAACVESAYQRRIAALTG